jgi:hypothetical protein
VRCGCGNEVTVPSLGRLREATGQGRYESGPVDTIRRMIETPGPVIVDVAVDPTENCFPMIPSGAAHNEMLLGPEDRPGTTSGAEEGMVLV